MSTRTGRPKAAPRYWKETLPSGRIRAVFRDPGGKKVSQTFDYEYEADTWGEAAMERIATATAGATAATPTPAPAGDLTTILEALKAAGVITTDQLAATPAAAAPTLREFVPRYLKARRGHVGAKTLADYESALRLGILADRDLATTPMNQLTRTDLEEWMGEMLEAGHNKPIINRRLKVLRIVVNYAMDNGLLDRDPTRGIDFFSHHSRKGRVLDDLEQSRLLAECHTPAERAQVLLALDAGLRWGEVAGLTADAVLGSFIDVRQVLDHDKRTVRPGTKAGEGITRIVPVATARLARALADLDDDGLMFTTDKGRPLDYYNWRRDFWRKATHKARLNKQGDRLRFHDLRHTCATRLVQARVPLLEVAQILGHADETTTVIYTHAGSDARRLELMRTALDVPAA